MRHHDLLNEKLGVGATVTTARYLYHLTDYHGYSYSIDQNALKTLRGSYVSTTDDPTMNSVGGRDHYDFKLVMDGNALLSSYEGFRYTDHYYELGNNGSRTRKEYNEREVGLQTRAIEPLSQYLVGTILRFSLFSEKGLQWMLYNPRGYKGFMDSSRDAAPQAIEMLYRQLFEWRKPVWIGEQGTLMTRQEMSFIHDAHKIAKRGGTFKTGFAKLADKYPIVSHDGEGITSTDVRRMFLAPKLVKLLNAYYVDRPRNKVSLPAVRNLLERIIGTIKLGNNAMTMIMGAIDDSGLLHPNTAPVTWGGIISKALTGDIDETIRTIHWYGSHEKKNRDWYDRDSDNIHMQRAAHYGTGFGRMGDR